jgi:hypothetical protein
MQNDRLFWSEDFARRETENECISNLTGGSGHGNTNRGWHFLESFGEKVWLNSFHYERSGPKTQSNGSMPVEAFRDSSSRRMVNDFKRLLNFKWNPDRPVLRDVDHDPVCRRGQKKSPIGDSFDHVLASRRNLQHVCDPGREADLIPFEGLLVIFDDVSLRNPGDA